MSVHAAVGAILILFLARIEPGHLFPRADDIDVTILPEAAPTPAPLPAMPLVQEPQITRHRHHPRHIEVEVKPPDEPAPDAGPDVAVAPNATSSVGAIPAPADAGNGSSDIVGAPDDSDDSANGDSDAPVAADRVAHPPEIETYVVPEYPRIARAHGIEGRVLLMVIVDESGKVEDNVTILNSIPMLDQAAVEAVHRWSFTPGRDADGDPVRVLLEVPVRFTLR